MTPDERFAEKMRARAEGRAPVIVTAPPVPQDSSPTAIEARYKAKMAQHGKPAPQSKGEGKPPAPPKPEVKTEGKGGEQEPSKPAPQSKGEARGKR